MAQAYLHNRTSQKATGKWNDAPYGDELDEGLRSANQQLSTVVERVADDELRTRIKSFHETIITAYMADSPEEAHAAFVQSSTDHTSIMVHLGSKLRELY